MEQTTANDQNDQQEKDGINLDSIPDGASIFFVEIPMKQKIRKYLETRPYDEVAFLLENAFADDVMERMWAEEGFKNLLDYLRKCPYNEVRPLIEDLSKVENVKHFQKKTKPAEEAPAQE